MIITILSTFIKWIFSKRQLKGLSIRERTHKSEYMVLVWSDRKVNLEWKLVHC